MKVQPQNQNFGAIKLKGPFNNDKAMKKIESIAKDSSLEVFLGRNWLGFADVYIKSNKHSAIEKQLVPQLKQAVGEIFKVKSISDKRAAKDVNRFINS